MIIENKKQKFGQCKKVIINFDPLFSIVITYSFSYFDVLIFFVPNYTKSYTNSDYAF